MSYTDTTTAEAYAREGTAEWLVLATIEHADLATPFRMASTYPDLTSRGDVFSYYAFAFKPPDEVHEGAPLGELRVDVVDQVLVAAMRALAPSPLTITCEAVVRARPDTVLRTWVTKGGKARVLDTGLMVIPLSPPTAIDEPWPGQRFTPARFPTLFRGVRD